MRRRAAAKPIVRREGGIRNPWCRRARAQRTCHFRALGTLPNFETRSFTSTVIEADRRNAIWPLARQRGELHEKGSALNLVMWVGDGTVD
ncbi:MAG: hypothetical protein ABI877_04420 [Gemmatimonadaceae bacterium]